MKCCKIRKLIPDFLEGQCGRKKRKIIAKHLQVCKDCAQEKRLYEESWQLIGQWKDVEPEPGFKTRFWNRLISQSERRFIPKISLGLLKRWSPVLATALTVLIVSSITLPNYLELKEADLLASKLNEEEIVLVENIDLLENLEIIEEIDFLEHIDIIKDLDKINLDTV